MTVLVAADIEGVNMESFLAELINNPKIPKWVRFVIVGIVCGLVIFLGVMLTIKSPMLIGKIFGGLLVVVFLAAAIYLFVKIAKSDRNKEE